MILFFLHGTIIGFLAVFLLANIHIHERDPRMKRLLIFLVLMTGGAAIVNRLLVLYGVDF
jgi:hypothetical protein